MGASKPIDELARGPLQRRCIRLSQSCSTQPLRMEIDFLNRQLGDRFGTKARKERAPFDGLRLDEYLRELRRRFERMRQVRRHQCRCVGSPIVLACLEPNDAAEAETDLDGVMVMGQGTAGRLTDP